jgi:hypothetical protein
MTARLARSLFAASVFSAGCATLPAYLAEPPRPAPDCYYYAATRVDMELLDNRPPAVNAVAQTIRAVLVVADLPISLAVDTGVLPLLLCLDTAQAIVDKEPLFDCPYPYGRKPETDVAHPSTPAATPTSGPLPPEKLRPLPLDSE